MCGLFQHCLTSQANSENGWEAIVYATECTGSNYISDHEEYKNLAVAPKYVFVRAGSDKTGGNSFTYFKDTYCPTHHKALASVNSAADQAEIMHLLNNVPGESYGVVLGGYNINPKTSARWYEDGSLVDSWGYSNWDIGEPNNSGERMVIYRSEGGWDDISSAQTDMGKKYWYACRRLTSSPTESPTQPTASPRFFPTDSPLDPTSSPSKSPTTVPSLAPSDAPSAPTQYPTFVPSKSPTQYPTLYPTISPSNYPTYFPFLE